MFLMTTSWATGSVTQMRKDGTKTASGASQYMRLSAHDGRMSSLDMSFTASATGWSAPWKPTRMGPIRICIRARALRSSHTSTSTVTDRNANRASAPRPYTPTSDRVTGPPRPGRCRWNRG